VVEDAETLFQILEHLAAQGRLAAERPGAACETRYRQTREDGKA
jgi:hypothetical protein